MASAPLTSVAPFRAVPTPEPREESAAPVRGADLLSPAGAGDALFGAPTPAAPRPASSVLVDDEPLATTGPSRGSGGHAPAPRVPRVPRQTTPSGAPSSSYGDWTKPSRTEDTGRSRLGADTGADVLRGPVAPPTTAIPERRTTRGGQAAEPEAEFEATYDDLDDRAAADLVHGAVTGPVKGGRAAYRAERQAADAARRKAAKRNGTPEVIFDDEPERKPRRVLTGLVAMAVVAGTVLGVYTVTSPENQEAAAQSASAPPSVPTVAPPSAALPPLTVDPVPVEPPVTTPVRVPVTVLNATNVTGLAGKISGVVVAGGWESPGVGAYPGADVATTTVFFTEGDEQQRQAALQLIDQFPDLAGPAPRFFEVADVPAPGLVVVATGNWQP
ncbi:LytR C-terminal domain-containing protein [Blastococcus sp. SYSU DS0973]